MSVSFPVVDAGTSIVSRSRVRLWHEADIGGFRRRTRSPEYLVSLSRLIERSNAFDIAYRRVKVGAPIFDDARTPTLAISQPRLRHGCPKQPRFQSWLG